jgi:hypothetical protein
MKKLITNKVTEIIIDVKDALTSGVIALEVNKERTFAGQRFVLEERHNPPNLGNPLPTMDFIWLGCVKSQGFWATGCNRQDCVDTQFALGKTTLYHFDSYQEAYEWANQQTK